MKKFSRRLELTGQIDQLARFHFGPNAFKQLTPPITPIFFTRQDEMGEGAVAEFTMWMGPLPIKWRAVHSDISEAGFTDKQEFGPFGYWKHRHQFNQLDEGRMELVDEVEAELGERPFWRVVSWFIWFNLPILFFFRHWQTKRLIASA